MHLRMILCLLGCGVCLTATAEVPTTPALNWTERSDWVNVKTDITPAAVGDGVADDTAAIQKAFDGVASGSVLYFPAGTYRITATLTLQPKQRVTGVLTLQTPKLQMNKRQDGQPNTAFDIRGYYGRIAYGPTQFYVEPRTMPLAHTGTRPLEIILWGCSFYNTTLSVRKDDAARIHLVGCNAVEDKAVKVEETFTPDATATLSTARDDLRALGETDLKLNHAEAR